MIRLSPSAINDFLTCPMLDKYKRALRLEPVKTPIYYLVGRAYHAGMEIFDIGGKVEVAEQNVHHIFDRTNKGELSARDIDQLEWERVKTAAMVNGYFHKYDTERDTYRNVQSEHEIEFPLVDGIQCYVRLDCLITRKDGKTIIRERKTATKPSGDYFTRTKLDTQVLAQLYATKFKFGELPDAFEYDVCCKPSIRPGVKDSVQSFEVRVRREYIDHAEEKQLYIRHDVLPDAARVREWFKEAQRVARLMEKVRIAEKWWKNPNSCISGYGSACAWLPACDSGTFNLPIYRKRT